jgi:4-amino-4-deoxy-L-arabinose transferase-like glycosyltransferase
VSFAREGFVFIAIAALVAAGTYALALNRRSWPLWLLAFFLTVVALLVAYFFRDPQRAASRGGQVVIAFEEVERAKRGDRIGSTRFSGLTTGTSSTSKIGERVAR